MPTRSLQDEAMRQLLPGVTGFRARYYERKPESMRQLATEGQKPQVLIIGCSDSRVDPALLTQAEPGELFVVRNVANLVPPYQPDGSYHGTSAAIEYAVRALHVRHVIVMGHAKCGGIQGLIKLRTGTAPPDDFLSPWVSIASAACNPYIASDNSEDGSDSQKVDADRLQQFPDMVERAAIRTSVDNLLTFPFVRERVESGELQLHGWWFDIETGDLWAIDPNSQIFLPVE